MKPKIDILEVQGAAVNGVRRVLRMKGFCILAVSTYAYSKFGSGWWLFLACFFLPDLSFIGFLAGSRTGAMSYNLAHSYVGPAICLAISMIFVSQAALEVSLIWIAHIGFDRALGFGLKYSCGFSFTHLGKVGRGHMKQKPVDS